MKAAVVRMSCSCRLIGFGFVLLASVGLPIARPEEPPAVGARQAGKPAVDRARQPWRAFGRVTDGDARPMAGVEVRAYCGMGTLRCTGMATSGADGRYALDFGPGFLMPRGDGRALQAATIQASRPGYFEANLNRQGGCHAAQEMPDETALEDWGGRKDRVFLARRPLEINFVMRPSARVSGKLVDEQGRPLAGYSVGLGGPDSPPSSSAMRSTEADAQGRFVLEDIPTTYRFQFGVRKAHPQHPWDDSWASAGLRFERPDGDDLRASFGDREIRIREFVLRVAGPGVHSRTANPVAGNAGVLDLRADDPADVLERNDRRLVLRSAVLTLRNTPRPDLGRSLIQESVPVAAGEESESRLTRTRPNEAGEFTVSFENPRGFELEPGKHQVIFQVFIGVSRKPIRRKIFKQLDARKEGRYRVPVQIESDWIDDSRVSLTFVTIQPDHDAWVRSFFHEGKGTKYSGIWAGDGNLLPAIPFEAEPSTSHRIP
jgi:hypothetical protein